jgi:hypothetical protein
MSMEPHPPKTTARLHVMLAREAQYAVILRRGPSKHVCTIEWDLDHDTFKLGQWFKGRLYENQCDLSPNGKYLLHGSINYRELTGGYFSYLVLSYAPYLKALKLWKFEFDTGAFTDSTHFFLMSRDKKQLFQTSPFRESKAPPPAIEPNAFEAWKFQRDGWSPSDKSKISTTSWCKKVDGWKLEMLISANKGHRYITYSVQDMNSAQNFDCTNWRWAEFRRGRLLWAKEGKIFAAHLHKSGHSPIKELADFNDWQFKPIEAPY